MYLILNGGDGTGKDTQFNLLTTHYPDAILLREPGGTPTAELIREVILEKDLSDDERIARVDDLFERNDVVKQAYSHLLLALGEMKKNGMTGVAEAHLFAASRAQTNETLVKPAKRAGKTLLGRRSVACSVAYQGVGRALGAETIFHINEDVIQGAMPDLEIFLDLDPEVAMERLRGRQEKQDRIDLEGEAFHNKVRDGYLYYYEHLCPYPHLILDASGTIEEVQNHIQQAVASFFAKIG